MPRRGDSDVLTSCLDGGGRVAITLKDLKEMIDIQAEDEGLWFVAATAPEAYLQQELRKLHALCERLIKEGTR